MSSRKNEPCCPLVASWFLVWPALSPHYFTPSCLAKLFKMNTRVRPLHLLYFFALNLTHGASNRPICEEITFNVDAAAEHMDWDATPGPDDELGHVRFLGDALGLGTSPVQIGTRSVGGQFTIAGTFCRPRDAGNNSIEITAQEPTLGNMRENNTDTLQILISGNTFNKESWDCYGYDETCSWTTFATSRGYHTLAIDRLGTGKSERPEDTIHTMQTGIQVDITHQIIQGIRSGKYTLGGSNYKRIVLGGFSYGSLLTYAIGRLYPSDIDGMILTGFSGRLFLPPSVLKLHFIPARHVTQKPQFMNLPVGYLTAATEGTSTGSLYYGSWDANLARLDWHNRDVVTAGEYASLGAALDGLSDFKGPVLVVAGDHDDIFCNESNGPCAESLAATKDMFPKLDPKMFSYFVAPEAGHGLLTHKSAPNLHRAVHDWLDEVL